MANRRQKKKKSAAAAKQAAAQYKGKNAPVKASPVKKPAETPVKEPVQEVKPVVEAKPQFAASVTPKQPETKVVPVKKAEPVKKQKKSKAKPIKKKVKTAKKLSFEKQIKAVFNKLGPTKVSAIVLAVCAVIALVCIVAWVSSSSFGIPDEAIPEYAGRNISSDLTLTVIDDLEIQHDYADAMKRKGDTKKFRYYACDELIFAEKNSVSNLGLVNVYDNECVLVATIVDDSGNVCYKSLGLLPGQCLTDVSIYPRPYGTYKMKLVVSAYDPESYELIGVQSSDLTVQVGIEEETTDVQKETQSEKAN